VKLSALKEFFPIIFLTVIVLVSVTLVAWTDSLTREEIARQEEEQIVSRLRNIFPDMSRHTFANDIYTIYSDGTELGYAFLATGSGYGGEISILVALDNETSIKAITIISQSETPGLGSRITDSAFTSQFAGLNIDDVALKQDGGEIDAITGSTISSGAVVDAVRTAAMEKVRSLKEQ
jgi:electron transport complex protein RnfG